VWIRRRVPLMLAGHKIRDISHKKRATMHCEYMLYAAKVLLIQLL